MAPRVSPPRRTVSPSLCPLPPPRPLPISSCTCMSDEDRRTGRRNAPRDRRNLSIFRKNDDDRRGGNKKGTKKKKTEAQKHANRHTPACHCIMPVRHNENALCFERYGSLRFLQSVYRTMRDRMALASSFREPENSRIARGAVRQAGVAIPLISFARTTQLKTRIKIKMNHTRWFPSASANQTMSWSPVYRMFFQTLYKVPRGTAI